MFCSGLAAPPSSMRVGSVFAGPNVAVVESSRAENAWYTTLRRLGPVPAPTFSDTCFVHWVLYHGDTTSVAIAIGTQSLQRHSCLLRLQPMGPWLFTVVAAQWQGRTV